MAAQISDFDKKGKSARESVDDILGTQLRSLREQVERLDAEIYQTKEDNPHSLELVVTARNQIEKQILDIETELEKKKNAKKESEPILLVI
jgi:hypothetical protein